uniref:At1g61320/AtMIF1 LRR domain-containing protein n=1 Tax=Aegilops tauschii TaxID=37682 RepID=M8B0Y6_AEGTA
MTKLMMPLLEGTSNRGDSSGETGSGGGSGRNMKPVQLPKTLRITTARASPNQSLSVEAKYDLLVGDPSTLRQMPEHHHDKLKSFRITGFCPQRSLVELTRHILESSMSIKCLILDTIRVNRRCFGNISRKCSTLDKAYIKEACESIVAIKTYIEGVVPSTTRLHVLGPCSRCHAL